MGVYDNMKSYLASSHWTQHFAAETKSQHNTSLTTFAGLPMQLKRSLGWTYILFKKKIICGPKVSVPLSCCDLLPLFWSLLHLYWHCCISLRSRRLEIVGTRKNGRASRVSLARARSLFRPLLPSACYAGYCCISFTVTMYLNRLYRSTPISKT